MDNKDEFEYTYSALSKKEKQEVEAIRDKYLIKENPREEFDEIKRLNKKVHTLPRVISIIVGIVGILVFGTGMSMVMVWSLYIFGVIVGLLGFVIMFFAYPLYSFIYQKQKDKYKDLIIELSNKCLKN